jgi:hypothetical protein
LKALWTRRRRWTFIAFRFRTAPLPAVRRSSRLAAVHAVKADGRTTDHVPPSWMSPPPKSPVSPAALSKAISLIVPSRRTPVLWIPAAAGVPIAHGGIPAFACQNDANDSNNAAVLAA